MKFTISKLFSNARAFLRPGLVVQALTVAFALFSATASAQPFVYVVGQGSRGPQFGTVDLASGRFHRIAYTQIDNAPLSLANLVWRNGSLLSLATSGSIAGSLVKINPATGEITVIGATGLGYNAFSLGEVNGQLYLTDFNTGGNFQNIYSVDPHSGAATLIGATGVPADPNIPFTTNADGTFNLCDESLYMVGGKLYAAFDSINVLPPTLEVDKYPADATVGPVLYEIDPTTGATTQIGPTYLYQDASIEITGTVYTFVAQFTGFPGGFPASISQLDKINLKTGAVTFLHVVDVDAGIVFGAARIRD